MDNEEEEEAGGGFKVGAEDDELLDLPEDDMNVDFGLDEEDPDKDH